jgi:hypothetical protein
MARSKATITLDKDKAAEAAALLGAASLSDAIDTALDRVIRAEQLRSDIAAYLGRPPTDEELGVADLPVVFDLGDEDVDYEAVYGMKK